MHDPHAPIMHEVNDPRENPPTDVESVENLKCDVWLWSPAI